MAHSDDLRRAGRTILSVLSWPLLAAIGTFVKLLLRAQDCVERLSRRILKRLFYRLHERGHVGAYYVARAVVVAIEAVAIVPLVLIRETAAGFALTLMGRDWRICEIVDGVSASVEYLPVGRYCCEAVAILRGGRAEEA